MSSRREKERKDIMDTRQTKRKALSEDNVKTISSKTPRCSSIHQTGTRKRTISSKNDFETQTNKQDGKIKPKNSKNQCVEGYNLRSKAKNRSESAKSSTDSGINPECSPNTKHSAHQNDNKAHSVPKQKISGPKTSKGSSKNKVETKKITTKPVKKVKLTTKESKKTLALIPVTGSSKDKKKMDGAAKISQNTEDRINIKTRYDSSPSESCGLENTSMASPTSLEKLLDNPKQNNEIKISEALDNATQIVIELVDHLPLKDTVTRLWGGAESSKKMNNVVSPMTLRNPPANDTSSETKESTDAIDQLPPPSKLGAIPKVVNKTKNGKKSKEKKKSQRAACSELESPQGRLDSQPPIDAATKRGKKRIRNKSMTSNQNKVSAAAPLPKKKPGIKKTQQASKHCMVTRNRNRMAENTKQDACSSEYCEPKNAPLNPMHQKNELNTKNENNKNKLDKEIKIKEEILIQENNDEYECTYDQHNPTPTVDPILITIKQEIIPEDEVKQENASAPDEQQNAQKPNTPRLDWQPEDIIRLYLDYSAVGTNLSISDIIGDEFNDDYMKKYFKQLPLTDEDPTVQALSNMSIFQAYEWLVELLGGEKRVLCDAHLKASCPCANRAPIGHGAALLLSDTDSDDEDELDANYDPRSGRNKRSFG